MAQKNISIECLRVLAALAVIIVHVSGIYDLNIADHQDPSWWVGNVFDSFARWSVPVFVMISGALLLGGKQEDSLQFYQKRYARLIYPLVFWSVFFILVRLATNRNFFLGSIPDAIFTGTPFAHLWYVYMLVGMYAVTPFLKLIVNAVSEFGLLVLTLCLFVAAVLNLFLGFEPEFFLLKFLPFLGYYVAGLYLNRARWVCPNRVLLLLFLIAWVVLFLSAGSASVINGRAAWLVFYDYLNPPIIVMSISVFLMAKNGLFNYSGISKYARNTFGVYLIHPVFLIFSRKMNLTGSPVLAVFVIPVASFAVFLLSDRIAEVMMRTRLGRLVLS